MEDWLCWQDVPGAARAVGMLMARNPYGELLPCHRVVSASGELSSRSFRQEQARRLRAEGVEVVDFHVDLSRYGWDGTEPIIKGGDLCVPERSGNAHLFTAVGFRHWNTGPGVPVISSTSWLRRMSHVWEIMPICHTDSSFSPAQCSLCPGRQSPAHRPAALCGIRVSVPAGNSPGWTGDGTVPRSAIPR